MKNIWTLIKLQFRARVSLSGGKTNDTHKRNFKTVAMVAVLLGVLAVFVWVYYMLAIQFVEHSAVTGERVPDGWDLSRPFLIFTLAVFMLLQTMFLLPSLVRNLDINNDRELLLKLPVSHRQIFASKIIVQYFFEVLFATFVLLPILIAFGVATGMHWGFFFYIPFIIMFVPVIPFFIASLLLFPATKLVNFLRSRTILTSIGYLVVLVGGIVLYMYVIEYAMSAITDQANLSAVLMDLYESGSMERTANGFLPMALFANLINTTWYTALWSAAAIIGVSAVLVVGAYFVAGANYKRTYMDERVSFQAVRRRSDFRMGNPMMATMKKDIKNITRSSNYTFQFVLLVILTPLIVYFVNRVAMFSSYSSFRFHRQANEAGGMLFGVSLLVMMMLLPMASAFGATNISREGHNIYHTKLIPQSFRKQLLSKVLIVLVPILLAVAISIGLILIPYNPDPVDPDVTFNLPVMDAMILLAIGVMLAVGYVCMGTYLDLRKPLCSQVGAGELTKSTAHINTIMGVGIVVGAIAGLLAMIGGFGTEVFGSGALDIFSSIGSHIWWIVLAGSGIFAAVSVGLLFFNGQKKYSEMEQ